MNMSQPDPAGLFEPIRERQQRQQYPAANPSVIAQLQNRPAPQASLPPVNAAPAPAESQPASPPPVSPEAPSSNPLVALSQSGQLQALLQAKAEQLASQPAPVNFIVELAKNGGIRKLVMAKEDQQYQQALDQWNQVLPLPGLGYPQQAPKREKPVPPARPLDLIEEDWNRGIHQLRGSEFSNMLNLLETGQMNPEQEAKITANIEPALDASARRYLQIARLSRDKYLQLQEQYGEQMAEQQRLKSEAGQSGLNWEAYRQASTPEQEEQLRSYARGITFQKAFTVDKERLNSTDADIAADERAKRNFYLNEQAKYPIASMAGNMMGATMPMAAGVGVLRNARMWQALKAGPPTQATAAMVARGGAPTSTLGVVAEGATVGFPYDLASRPVGAENMTFKERMTAAAEQAGFGLVLGPLADLGLTKGIPLLARGAQWTGDKVSGAINSVVDARHKQGLDQAAGDLGYKDFDEFADAATEIVSDETGSRIRLKPEVLNGLSEADQARAGDLLNRLNPEAADVARPDTTANAGTNISRTEQAGTHDLQSATDGQSALPAPETTASGASTQTASKGAGRSAANETEPALSGRSESLIDELEPEIAEPPTKGRVQGLQVVEAPLSELTLSRDVPQFKSGANDSGVVEPLGGTFERTGVAPIQVWVRNDGTKEVISGRHRLDLAIRSGEETIPAQYHYESEGFAKEQAATLDAILNIREGQGKVKDYVDYIKGAGLTKEAADAEGILGRATGQRAYTIATDGSDTLITAHRNDRLSDEAATRIAHAAPKSERLQAVGLKAIEDGKSITVAENMVKAVRSMTDDSPTSSLDMFGFDDTALKQAEQLARAAAAKQAEIQKTLSAVKGAAKNPTLARKEGVDINDPEGLNRRIQELENQKEAWRNWHTNPALVAELRGELDLLFTVNSRTEPEPEPIADTVVEVPENQGGFFDDFGLTHPTARELEARDRAQMEAANREQQVQAQMEAKARADAEVDDFELGIQGSGRDVSARQGDLLGAGRTEEPLYTQSSLKSEGETSTTATETRGADTPSPEELDTIAKKQATNPEPGTSLYSTPFIPAARQVANMMHLNPGASFGGAVYGGIAAGDASEAERYSPKWWLDSVFGAVAGAAAGAAGISTAKRTRVKGRTLLGENSWGSQSIQFMGDKIRKIPGFSSGDKDILPLKKQQKLMKALIERQAEKAGRYLLDNFTPAERAAMADLIEQRGIIAQGNLLHRQAQELDDFIAFTAKKMQNLGMLDDSIEPGGYLHRYYTKDLGISGLMRGLTPRGKTMSGSWSRRRGLQEVYDNSFMSPMMRNSLDEIEKLQVEQAGLKKKMGGLFDQQTEDRLDQIQEELEKLQSVEYREYLAPQNGQIKSFFVHSNEVPVIPGANNRALNPRQMALTARRWTIDGKQGDKGGILHRDWTKSERQSWGEIEDAAYRMVRGQVEVAHDLSLGVFYKQVVDRFQGTKVSDTEIPSWEKVPDTKVGRGRLKKYGALAGKYVTPEVWAAIKHHGRNPLLNMTNSHPAVKNYLNLLSKWKAYKTVYNPVSHMNNSVGNLGMYYMSDYSPKYLGSAIKELYQGENSALYREARDNGLFGTSYTSTLNVQTGQRKLDKLLEELRTQPPIPNLNQTLDILMRVKQWFIESKNAVAGANGPWQTGVELAAAVGKPFVNTAKKPINKAADAMKKAYQLEDEFFKMAVYMAERQKGTRPAKAVQAANQYFFDYSEMPTAVQMVRDSPLGSPFISYTYYAIPAMVRTAIEKPEKLFAFAAFLEGVNYAGMAINDELKEQGYWDQMAEEEKVLPTWMKGRSLFGALNNISIPYVDSYKMGLANMIPAGNPFVGNAEREGAWPAALSFWGPGWYGSNPMTVLLNDITTNTDWRGAQIYNPKAPTSSEKIRKAMNYIYQNVTPSNAAFPGSYAQQKLIEGSANEVRNAEMAGEEPNAILEGMVDMANAVSETMGGGQFTGLDRRENEILFRDALYSAIGIKRRPVRIDQFVESKTVDLAKERQGLSKWLARHEKDYSDNRITTAQIEKYRRQYEVKNQELDEKGARIETAQ